MENDILHEKRHEWNAMRSGDCTDTFTTNATDNFLYRMCCNTQEKHHKKEPGLFKEKFGCTEMKCSVYAVKRNITTIGRVISTRLAAKVGGPMSKDRKVLEESVNLTSTNRGFPTVRYGVATYEQTKKRLSFFTPKNL